MIYSSECRVIRTDVNTNNQTCVDEFSRLCMIGSAAGAHHEVDIGFFRVQGVGFRLGLSQGLSVDSIRQL